MIATKARPPMMAESSPTPMRAKTTGSTLKPPLWHPPQAGARRVVDQAIELGGARPAMMPTRSGCSARVGTASTGTDRARTPRHEGGESARQSWRTARAPVSASVVRCQRASSPLATTPIRAGVDTAAVELVGSSLSARGTRSIAPTRSVSAVTNSVTCRRRAVVAIMITIPVGLRATGSAFELARKKGSRR